MSAHRLVGYAHLRHAFDTRAFEPSRPARVYSVQKMLRLADCLQVPEHVVPRPNASPLEHLLFALKREVLDLQAAVLALKKMNPAPLVQQFSQASGSCYLQQACFLWEMAHGQILKAPEANGATRTLFDQALFLTGPSRKVTLWCVDFNGLGTPIAPPSGGHRKLTPCWQKMCLHRRGLLCTTWSPPLCSAPSVGLI